MYNDLNLRKYLSDKNIEIIKEAIEDHRASSNHIPRSIYGKIVASADRNINVDIYLNRTYNYTKNHNKDLFFNKPLLPLTLYFFISIYKFFFIIY